MNQHIEVYYERCEHFSHNETRGILGQNAPSLDHLDRVPQSSPMDRRIYLPDDSLPPCLVCAREPKSGEGSSEDYYTCDEGPDTSDGEDDSSDDCYYTCEEEEYYKIGSDGSGYSSSDENWNSSAVSSNHMPDTSSSPWVRIHSVPRVSQVLQSITCAPEYDDSDSAEICYWDGEDDCPDDDIEC